VSDVLGGEQRHVPKPWGSEQIWALTERYCGKIIRIDAGRRLSLQRHARKEESLIVLSGTLRLHLEDDDGVVRTRDVGPGEAAHVDVPRIHRFEAVTDVELVEVSTPEIDDVERLEDDFGREGTSAP
jgi:mannose-6-phosphate isomerase-like protein (cupin superfamily)